MEEETKIYLCFNCNKPILKDKRAKRLCSTRFHKGCRTKYRKKFKPIFCACGCGGTLIPVDINGLHHIFKTGHYAKTQDWTGDNNPRFNEYSTINSQGYKMIRKLDHKFVNGRGYIQEHRVIYEEYHKCCLLEWGVIHHKNANKLDNRIENLEGMTVHQHNVLEITKRHRNNRLKQI